MILGGPGKLLTPIKQLSIWYFCFQICDAKIKRKDLELHILKHKETDLQNMFVIAQKTSTKLYESNKRKRKYEKMENELLNCRKRLKLVANISADPSYDPSSLENTVNINLTVRIL